MADRASSGRQGRAGSKDARLIGSGPLMAIMQVTVATPRPGPDMKESGGRYGPPLRYHHANEMLWFFSGTERMRLPVAAKNALSTAGAATKIVGSPTPPQNPPDGIRIVSTFGICAMRITS